MTRFNKTREFVNYSLSFVSGRTLDLGAGTAKYKNIIKQKAGEYLAMDLFPGPKVDVIGDIHKTPFKDGEFDTVISTQTLEHTRKPWVVAGEVYRILKPGGFAIIAAPFMVGYHADPEDNFRFTKDGLALLFSDVGFKVIEKDFYGNMPATVSEMLHFQYMSPYKKHSRLAKKLMDWITTVLFKFDRFSSSKAIHVGAYVIAQKPII